MPLFCHADMRIIHTLGLCIVLCSHCCDPANLYVRKYILQKPVASLHKCQLSLSLVTKLSLCTGAKYTFTIKEGADGKNGRISVNYDGFIDDVSVNDMLLVDGGMLSLKILEKTKQDVVCEVVDGGVMGSRYILH